VRVRSKGAHDELAKGANGELDKDAQLATGERTPTVSGSSVDLLNYGAHLLSHMKSAPN
jgi:hypothetical protein